MKIHIVQKGDTLWDIANKYDVDYEELKDVNSHLSSPDMIMPGMKIKVPSTTKAVKKETQKKETPIKEVKTNLKETPKEVPKMEEDEAEKPLNMKPEMPLPQMPQPPQMPNYPIMQMPGFDNEMNHEQLPTPPKKEHMKKETPKVEKPKEEKKVKQLEQEWLHKHQPMPEQHMNMPPEPMPHPCESAPHMHPVCCHYVHPCFAQMPCTMMPMQTGPMNGHHHHHQHHSGMGMPMGQQDVGCGCHGSQPHHQFEHHMKMPPGGYEMMSQGQPMQSIQSMNQHIEPIQSMQRANYNPVPPNTSQENEE